MFSSVIGSGLSLMAFNITDFLQVLLNPFALITALFYSISLLINSIIYPLAAYAYTLFPIMCELDFSALAPVLQNIISRLEVFIGIFMLFVVAFNLLQYMIDPDKKEGATSKLITKIIVALILLVSSSFIFGILDELQTALISRSKDNIAQTVLFGKSIDNSEDDLTVGRRIVYAVFFNMYENQDYGDQYGYDKEYNDLVAGESFLSLIGHLWQTPETYSKVYYHYPFLAEVFGIFLIILFGTFAIDIGVRNITLLFLRILFPIAAIGYITPKGEGILSKYISTYISTYVQIFLKTFMIYLLLYIFLWFMQTLTSIDGALFGNMKLDDTTKTILLLLIVVALFTFFTKGLPAILKNVFGIETQSSLGNLFGKALGIASAGASLAVGGIAGGIMGKAAGAGAKGVLKGMAAGAKGGAQAGWNAGKQISSGNIGGAVVGYGRGMSGTYGSINKTVSSTKTKAEIAANQAQSDEKKYEQSKEQLAKERAILNEMESHKGDSQEKMNEYNAQNAKVAALQNQTNKLAELSQQSANKARKLDSNYVSNIEKKAVEAENNYNSKQATYNDAVNVMNDYRARFGENSVEYQKASASVDSAKLAMDAAQRRAVASAEEAKKWNDNYNSPILVASSSAERQGGNQQTVAPTDVAAGGGTQQAAASTDVRVEGGTQHVATPTDVVAEVGNQQTVTPTDVRVEGTQHVATATDVVAEVGNQQTVTPTDVRVEGGTQHVATPTDAVVGGGTQQTVAPSDVVVGGGTQHVATPTDVVVGEYSHFNTTDQVVTTNSNVERNANNDNNLSNKEVNNPESNNSVNTKSNYDDRKDADKDANDAENERIRNEKVGEIRGAFGTDINDSDNEKDDETAQILEIPEEEPIDPIDSELEAIMQNDIRAYGERASRKFRELTEEKKMDAVIAMTQVNQEAHDTIKSIAKDLIKQGKSVRDAYEEARIRYNNEE